MPSSYQRIKAQQRHLEESNKGKAEIRKIDFEKFNLPYYEWTLRFRQRIEGKPNVLKYLPMWHQIYRDEHPWIMLAIARQRGKSTWGGGLLAYYGSKMHKKGVYVTFSDTSLRNFSNDKYRGSILHPDNPELYEIVKGAQGDKGAVSRVEFLTDSSTSLVTDANQMHHVEGQSADLLVLDEDQNLDLDAYYKASLSQSWTQGRTVLMGIGGYLGTQHHKYWLSSNQMDFTFSKQYWRDKLEFNSEGLVWDDYLIDLCAGEWIAKAPQNWTRHGYHMPMEIFPNVPLTREDAIHKYKVSVEFSIEQMRQDYPADYFQRHVEANFIKGTAKPFTKDMILKMLDRTLDFTRAADVDHKKGKIYASTDWGGGTSAFTVPIVTQCLHPTAPIFRVLYAARWDEKDVDKQADMFINLCDAYEADAIGIDMGGGPRQAQKVSTYFGGRCTMIQYQARPESPLPNDKERTKLKSENRFWLDRTFSMDVLADLFNKHYAQNGLLFPRFILPGKDASWLRWFVDMFEAVDGELVKNKATGQYYIKYTHDESRPDDAVHSCNYNWITQMLDRDSDFWLKSF